MRRKEESPLGCILFIGIGLIGLIVGVIREYPVVGIILAVVALIIWGLYKLYNNSKQTDTAKYEYSNEERDRIERRKQIERRERFERRERIEGRIGVITFIATLVFFMVMCATVMMK